MNKGESRADANRRVRQDALREQLSAKGLVQQVIESAEKLADLVGIDMDSIQVQRVKAANDARLALIKKYLPDLKQTELNVGGQENNPLEMKWVTEVVHTNAKTTDTK